MYVFDGRPKIGFEQRPGGIGGLIMYVFDGPKMGPLSTCYAPWEPGGERALKFHDTVSDADVAAQGPECQRWFDSAIVNGVATHMKAPAKGKGD
ncbi:MAG: hypothetical protein PHU75_03855 [Candidatus Nanopelagicales bacterium]|nr:hypothetical protein [Candidatus Nanopelagicales bacterium]